MTKTLIKYEISDQPTGKADAIYMQHDVDYSVSKDEQKVQNEAGQKWSKLLMQFPVIKDSRDIHWHET